MAGLVKVLRNLGLLIARVGLGIILLLHGWTRWQSPEQGVQRQIDYLNQFGTPYPAVAAWGAIALELVGGVCLIIGALTPLIGLGVVLQQILTIAYTNWYRGIDLLNADGSYAGGFEYNVALGLLGLLFAVLGAGGVSMDQLLRGRKPAADDDVPAMDSPASPRKQARL